MSPQAAALQDISWELIEVTESGSTIISMNNSSDIIEGINFAIKNHTIPDSIIGYHDLNVSKKILNIILSNYEFDKER